LQGTLTVGYNFLIILDLSKQFCVIINPVAYKEIYNIYIHLSFITFLV